MGGVIRPTGLSRPGSASPPDEFCEERRLCPAAPLLLSARAVVTACRCQRAARSLGHPRPGSRVSREDERGAGVEGSSAAPPRRGPFLQAAKSPRGESVAEGLRATSPQKTRPKESAAEGGGAPPSFSRPPSGSRGKALPLTRQGGDAADRASPPMKEAAGQVRVLRLPQEPGSAPVRLRERKLPEPGLRGLLKAPTPPRREQRPQEQEVLQEQPLPQAWSSRRAS